MQIIEGQTAVVTGAGSGIGRALAQLCAEHGMRVVAADIEMDAAQQTVAAITANGREALATRVDVTKPDDLAALAELTWQQFGGCHLLCNNAGVAIEKPIDQCSPADWQWIINVNLLGVANSLANFLPRLKQQGGAAHIVNTASITGLIPLPSIGPYVASKFAVVGLSEVLHQELAQTEIGVSILCPGAVDTRISESERNRPGHQSPTDKKAMGADLDTTYARMLTPEAVAAMTLQAVRDNQLYVPTHPEWLPLFDKRSQAITAAFQASTELPIR